MKNLSKKVGLNDRFCRVQHLTKLKIVYYVYFRIPPEMDDGESQCFVQTLYLYTGIKTLSGLYPNNMILCNMRHQ